MILQRDLTQYLSDFYRHQKMALLLTGARQTGKTYAIRQLGKTFKNFVEINFIERPEAVEIFKNAGTAQEILLRLSALTEQPLVKGETLIFFDEVQCCKEIVTAIKFLVDEGSYRYALSGSLLGVELTDIRSVPVGYLAIKEVYPLDFEEFVRNIGVSPKVLEHLKECWEKCEAVDEVIHKRMLALFYLYITVGGMPAAVTQYIDSNDMQRVVGTQRAIIDLYRKDISQYATSSRLRIKEVFDLIPSELDSKNKRFILKRLNEHAKYERYTNDFLWLKNAGVAIPVYNVETPRLPLRLAETRNLFKLFSNDTGLLTAQYAGGIQAKLLSGDVMINYGAVFENVIAQELLCHGYEPYYYNSKRLGEVDFVVADNGMVLPIEVKSGKDYKRHNALNNLVGNKDFGISKGLVLSQGNMEREEHIIYAPVYMVMFLRPQENLPRKYKVDLTGLI